MAPNAIWSCHMYVEKQFEGDIWQSWSCNASYMYHVGWARKMYLQYLFCNTFRQCCRHCNLIKIRSFDKIDCSHKIATCHWSDCMWADLILIRLSPMWTQLWGFFFQARKTSRWCYELSLICQSGEEKPWLAKFILTLSPHVQEILIILIACFKFPKSCFFAKVIFLSL